MTFDPPVPRRSVKIGEAASLAGTTPRAIRHYHQIGLLPEPGRGTDDRRRYGYEDIVRLLWIRRMTETGLSLDDVRTVLTADGHRPRQAVLEALDQGLAEKEAAVRAQREVLRRLRSADSGVGLLSPAVGEMLERLGAGPLKPEQLDELLVTERILGPEQAALRAADFGLLATDEKLRAEQDRLDRAAEALTDPEDPAVEELAARYFAHYQTMEEAGRAAGVGHDGHEPPVEVDRETGRAHWPGLDEARRLPSDVTPVQLRIAELVGAMFGTMFGAQLAEESGAPGGGRRLPERTAGAVGEPGGGRA
ncbi:MerR family transcriptional regulator [Streptomyces carminius]|uniref:MerR family transcriptional regulator n=1 Tax=Streptomyces carminius TaxID=2665496 RepID=A0A2M8LX02_9ACTN|nr:MerR family transcriptional regulator [Streptomyces carminius]PJE96455.1 MerR family transcriptional regulator [Streptomyces carminius]